MLVRREAVASWRRTCKSLQVLAAYGLLFAFTLSVVLKIDNAVSLSWWGIFSSIWLFHAVVARCRFCLPAPSIPHDRRWAPFHAVMATPLLVAFELLLCIHLENNYVVTLKIVFIPLLAFEVAVLMDNISLMDYKVLEGRTWMWCPIYQPWMCRALMPGDDETISDEAIWETLPHFWVAISMIFLIVATVFTLLKLSGDLDALGWWDLFINFSIAECFSFLVCTRWYNSAIHGDSQIRETGSSSMFTGYLDWNSGLIITSDENQDQSRLCNMQEIGGHIMKVPLIIFQILLFMRLEGTPSSARHMPLPVVFSPLLLLQGAGVLYAISRLVENIILLLSGNIGSGRYSTISSSARDCFEFLHRGSRFLGWWCIDEGSREEQARLYYARGSGYNTFSPDIVKKLPKSDLADEIWRLQEALREQSEITRYSQQEYERLQNERILCRVCFEARISVLLLPCRHHILCSTCGERCTKCPICRVSIEERLPIHDV